MDFIGYEVRKAVRDAMNTAMAGIDPMGPVGVFLSGGLDSAIILLHLKDHFPLEQIHAFHLLFGVPGDTGIEAQRVADEIGVGYYHEIILTSYLNLLPEILKNFSEPRWNVWPWWLMRAAAQKKIKHVFIGEGADEVFGGYADRDYLEGWAGQLIYVKEAFLRTAEYWKRTVHVPFYALKHQTIFHYGAPSKTLLRKAYRESLPETRSGPPAMTKYIEFWRAHLRERYPNRPGDHSGVKEYLQVAACEAWLKTRQ